MTKHCWLADEFVIEFNKLKKLIVPQLFKYQIDKVAIIIDHWTKCHHCKLGYDLSEYSGSFNEVFLKLAAAHTENHICNGDYEVLGSRRQHY